MSAVKSVVAHLHGRRAAGAPRSTPGGCERRGRTRRPPPREPRSARGVRTRHAWLSDPAGVRRGSRLVSRALTTPAASTPARPPPVAGVSQPVAAARQRGPGRRHDPDSMTPVDPSFRSRAWAVPARADGRWGEDGHEAAGGDLELGVESPLETGGWWTHGLPPVEAVPGLMLARSDPPQATLEAGTTRLPITATRSHPTSSRPASRNCGLRWPGSGLS